MGKDAGAATGHAQGAARVSLGLVFCPDDAERVSELLFTLVGRVEFVEDGPADGVLVVVSQAAVTDAEWLAAVRRHADEHLVPLKIGAIKNAPAEVAHINWAPFDPEDLERTADIVVAAAQTDASRHRVRRALEADALLWAIGDRPPAVLILDLGRIRAADAAIATGDPLAQPNELGRTYLEASRAAAKRARRNRAWQVTWRVGAVAIAVALLVVTVIQFREVAARQALAVGASDIAASVPPSIRAIKAAALLVDLPEDSAPGRAGSILAVQALAEEWPVVVLAPSEDGALNSSVLTSSGTISADGYGTLRWWGDDDTVDRRVAISDGPLYGLAATPDGGYLAAYGATSLYLVDESGRITAEHALPFAPSAIAISHEGHTVTITNGGALATVGGAAGLTEAVPDGTVLRLVPIASTVLALTLTDDTIRLIDAATGDISREWQHELPAETAGLSEADFDTGLGVGYLAGPGNQLWRFDDAAAALPTGLGTPIAPASVEVTPRGWVLVASTEEGVTLHFPDESITYGRVCALVDVPVGTSIAPDGNTFACLSAMSLAVYELDRLGPVADPTSLPREGPEATRADAAVPSITAFSPGGEATDVSLDNGREYRLNVPVTAHAESGTGTIVFASGDDVTLLEPTLNGPVLASLGSVPGGGTITGLEWLAAGDVLATTDDGLSWRLRGCAGCLGGGGVIDVIAARLRECFATDQLAIYPEGMRARFGLRECAAAPAAKAP